MAKLCLKKQSKRQPARRRYKIEKKIRDHNRKTRREAKKLERKGSKKTINVPNLCPFKEDILKTVEEYKRQKELERERARQAAKEAREAAKPQTLTELAEKAEQQRSTSPPPFPDDDLITKKSSDGKQRSFYREFQKVVGAADVILEVVDARDPLGTRCPQVETMVRDAGDNKRLLLILNKADLVPRDNLDKWLAYLRRSVPAIPFKSSTQAQGKRLGRRKMSKGGVQGGAGGALCRGAEALTSLLANYCRNKGVKTSIRVGVVGLPNVGKSSLINSLKRSRACKVGAVPGVTRNVQEVELDSKVRLLDSPGLALAAPSDPHAALKNSVLVRDARAAANMVLARAQAKHLCELYLLPPTLTQDTDVFLAALAKRFGKFGKGGVADLQAAAQILLHDWHKGKISYHTSPPEDVTSSPHVSSAIITADLPAFDLDSYDKVNMLTDASDAMDTATDAPSQGTSTFVVSADAALAKRNKKKKGGKSGNKGEVTRKKGETMMEAEAGLKTRKLNKIQQKKLRKLKKKHAKSEAELTSSIQEISL